MGYFTLRFFAADDRITRFVLVVSLIIIACYRSFYINLAPNKLIIAVKNARKVLKKSNKQ